MRFFSHLLSRLRARPAADEASAAALATNDAQPAGSSGGSFLSPQAADPSPPVAPPIAAAPAQPAAPSPRELLARARETRARWAGPDCAMDLSWLGHLFRCRDARLDAKLQDLATQPMGKKGVSTHARLAEREAALVVLIDAIWRGDGEPWPAAWGERSGPDGQPAPSEAFLSLAGEGLCSILGTEPDPQLSALLLESVEKGYLPLPLAQKATDAFASARDERWLLFSAGEATEPMARLDKAVLLGVADAASAAAPGVRSDAPRARSAARL
jgi:hypothetical protein